MLSQAPICAPQRGHCERASANGSPPRHPVGDGGREATDGEAARNAIPPRRPRPGFYPRPAGGVTRGGNGRRVKCAWPAFGAVADRVGRPNAEDVAASAGA